MAPPQSKEVLKNPGVWSVFLSRGPGITARLNVSEFMHQDKRREELTRADPGNIKEFTRYARQNAKKVVKNYISEIKIFLKKQFPFWAHASHKRILSPTPVYLIILYI
jgi:hypothetical protein